MGPIDKNKTGLTFGFLISFLHLMWSALVALGVAQVLLDFILRLHMMSMPITILPFSIVSALELIALTFVSGYVFGWLMAFFWNKCIAKRA
jgi:thiamine transporter ThiT